MTQRPEDHVGTGTLVAVLALLALLGLGALLIHQWSVNVRARERIRDLERENRALREVPCEPGPCK